MCVIASSFGFMSIHKNNILWCAVRRMIVPAAVGILLGFLAVLNLAIILLPSTIKTIMQFRYGCLGSLNDNVFLDYRIAGKLLLL